MTHNEPVVLYFSRMKSSAVAADIEEAIHSVNYGTVRTVVIESFRMDYNHKMFMRGVAVIDNWNYDSSESSNFITQLSLNEKGGQLFFPGMNLWCKVTLFRLESGTRLCKQVIAAMNPSAAIAIPLAPTIATVPLPLTAAATVPLPLAPSIAIKAPSLPTKRKIITSTNRAGYYSPNKHQTCVLTVAPALSPSPVQTEYDSEDELLNDVFYTVQAQNMLPIAPTLPTLALPIAPALSPASLTVQTEYDSEDELLNEVLETVQSPTAYV